MKRETIYKLAQHNQQCWSVHLDIKELIPEEDAQALLEAGFTDCSWANDECPSYCYPKGGSEAILMAVDDVDDEYNRISGKITYFVSGETDSEFSNVVDAIHDYKGVCSERV